MVMATYWNELLCFYHRLLVLVSCDYRNWQLLARTNDVLVLKFVSKICFRKMPYVFKIPCIIRYLYKYIHTTFRFKYFLRILKSKFTYKTNVWKHVDSRTRFKSKYILCIFHNSLLRTYISMNNSCVWKDDFFKFCCQILSSVRRICKVFLLS